MNEEVKPQKDENIFANQYNKLQEKLDEYEEAEEGDEEMASEEEDEEEGDEIKSLDPKSTQAVKFYYQKRLKSRKSVKNNKLKFFIDFKTP